MWIILSVVALKTVMGEMRAYGDAGWGCDNEQMHRRLQGQSDYHVTDSSKQMGVGVTKTIADGYGYR